MKHKLNLPSLTGMSEECDVCIGKCFRLLSDLVLTADTSCQLGWQGMSQFVHLGETDFNKLPIELIYQNKSQSQDRIRKGRSWVGFTSGPF
jgi:hypothetical protein